MYSFRNNRLRDHDIPLVLGKAKTRDRSGLEVQDYRRALNAIHTDTLDTLRRLHALCRSESSDAGRCVLAFSRE